MGGDKVPIRGTGFGIERHCAAGSGHRHPLRPPNTPKENMLHPPPRLFSTILVISGVHAGKTPYNTEHLKGFYTERICGTVFTDRCSQISTRIVCGQVHYILQWSIASCPTHRLRVPIQSCLQVLFSSLFFFSSPFLFSSMFLFPCSFLFPHCFLFLVVFLFLHVYFFSSWFFLPSLFFFSSLFFFPHCFLFLIVFLFLEVFLFLIVFVFLVVFVVLFFASSFFCLYVYLLSSSYMLCVFIHDSSQLPSCLCLPSAFCLPCALCLPCCDSIVLNVFGSCYLNRWFCKFGFISVVLSTRDAKA